MKAIMLTHYLMDEKMTREKIQEKLRGHELQKLWRKTENIIRKYLSESIKKDRSPLDIMATAIQELNYLDPSSMMFRYPFDVEYKDPQLIGNREHNYGVDYGELKLSFDRAYNYFLGCFHVIYSRYEELEIIPTL
ncbi:hypothetical protein [Brevibacillus halotolerans]|uniref:hypothetical protein n=1 Tax=Brevibacillus halotolerans TaxID=1507437 RepID=UPI0015EF9AB9|nr:hypothetical protein [Brevibacillus halotolerans]MBA4533304.1 hypothetical protein [Brevibacillus halotolerans]